MRERVIPLSSPLYPMPPYHYDNARLFLALFYAPEESLRSVLPPPLRPSDMNLMALLFAEQPCRETGTFRESSVLAQCLFKDPESDEERVGVHFCRDYVDSDVALAAGREIWGFPRKMARTEMEWDGDTLRARTIRNDAVIMSATCTFTDSGEWIDSGPAVNVKIMPSVTGEGNDIDVITIADLEYRIKSGRSGDVQVTIQGCPDDDMSMIHVESTMIGLYFDTDILVPPGRVIGRTLG